MSFIDQLAQTTNGARTDNGAKSNKSTLDPVLDFFSKAGAMRNDIPGAVKLFEEAYNKDKLLAVRCLFYLRDVRGGQGERDIFRACLQALEDTDESVAKHILKFVPEYGRWDDVFSVRHPETLRELAQLIGEQIRQDEANEASLKPVSLLAKWLPSENASSKVRSQQARSLASLLGWSPSEYRRRVVKLRKYIKLLEQKMSQKEWGNIDYEKLPSQAHRKHVKAFKRNDGTRYEEYIGSVEKGEKKINSSTMFTYEIYDMVSGYGVDAQTVRTADAMWKALPDFTDDTNALVMADVSGSMAGRPMATSVSLAIYFAERNKGIFKDHYMTFTDTPRLVKVPAGNIQKKMAFVEGKDVGYNTDLEAAFRAILKAAVDGKCSQEELPKVLYIISDMQFDSQMDNCDETNFETAKRLFNEAGYELPHVVFWNVNARDDSPATKYDGNVTLISGSSQSTFKYAVAGKTPLDSMNDILNSERYARITVEEDIPF